MQRTSSLFRAVRTVHQKQNAIKRMLSTQSSPRILITGCLGQIGTELMETLRTMHGRDNVICTDVRKPSEEVLKSGPYFYADVSDASALHRIVVENQIDWVVHNAALLSGTGEKNPQLAIQVNIGGLHNILEVARTHNLRLYVPSSIAAFGPTTPLDNTPDVTIQRPTTVYGVSKVYAEHLGEYYAKRFGVDFRSLRYPGVISYKTLPGGGTTDYAIEMFHYALQKKPYECFIEPHEKLPMMYMHDCIRCTVDILHADPSKLSQRTYNVTAMSFSPAELADAIRKYIPNFTVTYRSGDFRQAIAQSWPNQLDDAKAREDWGWKEDFDLDHMVRDMLDNLSKLPPIKLH